VLQELTDADYVLQIFSVPNNSSEVESVNATLQPDKFGIDFFESLEGQLVTVPHPVAVDFENSFGVSAFPSITIGPTKLLSRNFGSMVIGLLPARILEVA